jgi:hypothetical protein
VTDDQVRVRIGQLWRRRQDGQAFIPAHRIDGGWMDRAGHRRSCAELTEQYVLVPIDEDADPTTGR